MDYQAARHRDACGDDLAGEFGLRGELDDVVGGTRCNHKQNCYGEHVIVNGKAGVRYQDGRPAKARTAVDGNRYRGDDAQKDSETAEARRRLRVDATLGRVIDGVKTNGKALGRGREDEGHDERGCGHENIWNEGSHAKRNAPLC